MCKPTEIQLLQKRCRLSNRGKVRDAYLAPRPSEQASEVLKIPPPRACAVRQRPVERGVLGQREKSWWNRSQTSNEILMKAKSPLVGNASAKLTHFSRHTPSHRCLRPPQPAASVESNGGWMFPSGEHPWSPSLQGGQKQGQLAAIPNICMAIANSEVAQVPSEPHCAGPP